MSNYTVKVFARKNAIEIDNQKFDNYPDAERYFLDTGVDASYWTELRNRFGATIISTVDVSGR